MIENKCYFVVVDDKDKEGLPLAVIRAETVDGVSKEYVATVVNRGWEPSNLLAELEAGQYDWTAREVDAAEAEAADRSMARAANRADEASWIGKKYRYYAIIGEGRGVERPLAMVRAWRSGKSTKEESFTRNLKWEPSDRLYRLSSGRDWEKDSVEVGEDAVEKFKQSITKWVQSSE